jgi:hypothetical protein
MRLYQERGAAARRDFVVTDYHVDERGHMLAEIPLQGPCGGEGGEACHVVLDHFRDRKTGPEHPLAVLRCTTHKRAFTVYPPGHVPYGREAIVRISPDGSLLDTTEESHGDAVSALFADTWFQAALDGARGLYWNPYPPEGTDFKWWSTQSRRLGKATQWFGVSPDMPEALRELICEALDVDLLLLRTASQGIVTGPGYRSRAEGVRRVLAELVRGPCILERMLLAGHMAGLWGRPLRWDACARILRSPPFQARGSPPADTPGPPEGPPRN